MGVVYLVEHVNTGDQLALKVLLGHAGARPDVVERFKREARAPARIKSDHVVKVTDADAAPELGGAPFLVMELLDGHDLEKRLAARGPLAPAEVAAILAQVAAALDKAHAIGIVHRDLKPENIFLHRRDSGEEVVKILDFGISKMLGDDPSAMDQAGLTKAGALMGTPLYMSPEQARGDVANIGPPTDVWAIGLIAFKLLTGQTYWWAQTMTALLLQIASEPLVPPSQRSPSFPATLDAWFLRSCERDPAARWASVGEQVGALAVALGVSVTPISRPRGDALAAAADPALGAGTPSLAISAHGVAHTQVPRPASGARGPRIAGATLAVLALVILAGVVLALRRPAPVSSPTAASGPIATGEAPASPPVVAGATASAAPDPPSTPSVAPSSSAAAKPSASAARPAAAPTTPRVRRFDPVAP
jgi:serine/threonine-protein kinase